MLTQTTAEELDTFLSEFDDLFEDCDIDTVHPFEVDMQWDSPRRRLTGMCAEVGQGNVPKCENQPCKDPSHKKYH